MNCYVMTLFPDMVREVLSTSILGRAADSKLIETRVYNIRDYSADEKHHKVDDYTYGGGAGMLMCAQPVYDCYQAVKEDINQASDTLNPPHRVIHLTPQGALFTQKKAAEYALESHLVFLCGHYEGIDERVIEEIVTDEISVGDYVLTGGELPALTVIDAVSRLLPGVLHNDASAVTDSLTDGLLEYPQYSRPEVWRGKRVPEILLSGDHAKVDAWRAEQSLERTRARRPDLYERYLAGLNGKEG